MAWSLLYFITDLWLGRLGIFWPQLAWLRFVYIWAYGLAVQFYLFNIKFFKIVLVALISNVFGNYYWLNKFLLLFGEQL